MKTVIIDKVMSWMILVKIYVCIDMSVVSLSSDCAARASHTDTQSELAHVAASPYRVVVTVKLLWRLVQPCNRLSHESVVVSALVYPVCCGANSTDRGVALLHIFSNRSVTSLPNRSHQSVLCAEWHHKRQDHIDSRNRYLLMALVAERSRR